jgi:hypothetical protein
MIITLFKDLPCDKSLVIGLRYLLISKTAEMTNLQSLYCGHISDLHVSSEKNLFVGLHFNALLNIIFILYCLICFKLCSSSILLCIFPWNWILT